MLIVSNASNKQMNVGKNANKGELPWQPPTGHLSLAPVTLISQWRMKTTKELTLNLTLGVSKNQEAGGGWGRRTKAKKLQRQLEASHEGKTTWQWLECATRSPADSRKSHS